MDRHGALLDLERAAWQALTSDGDAAVTFSRDVLADQLILMPGGLVIDDRNQVIESMRGTPWASFDLENERVHELTPDSAVVAYEATAHRDGADDYHALINSTYIREDGAWKLAVHQQTPI